LKRPGIVIRNDRTSHKQEILSEAFQHPKVISTCSNNQWKNDGEVQEEAQWACIAYLDFAI